MAISQHPFASTLCLGLGLVLVQSSIGCGQTTRMSSAANPVRVSSPPSEIQSDFKTALTNWPHGRITRSPIGDRVYLGDYVDEPVELSIRDLPEHDYIRLSFDLLTLGTWDGNGKLGYGAGGSISVGPDSFRVVDQQGDRRLLLMSDTFSNIPAVAGFKSLTKSQSFPSPVPGELLESQSGSLSHNTLGVRYNAGPGFDMDAVYQVTLIFPHTDHSLQTEFSALMRDPNKEPRLLAPEEYWGLDNVKIEALPASAVTHPDEATSKSLLETAADAKDPAAAREDYVKLLGGGAATRKVLLAARAEAGVDWAEVDRQINALVLGDPEQRARARSKLSTMGAVIEMQLRVAENEDATDEGSDECRSLLDDLAGRPISDPKQRRAAVANRVLHVIGEK